MEKRVDASTQPCLVPLLTGNGSDNFKHSYSLASSSLMEMSYDQNKFLVQLCLCRIVQRLSLFTASNAFVRSMNTVIDPGSVFCIICESASWQRSYRSAFPLPALNSHCYSGCMESTMSFSILFRTMYARIFPVMERRDIPQ